MNQLSTEKRAQIINCLVEGNSIRSTVRITGASKNTVTKLLVELGDACRAFQDAVLRNLPCKRIQCDEIWSFVGCKENRLRPEQKGQGRGDCWTWTALDPETKLMVAWHVGRREASDGIVFMEDLASRLSGRIQLTSDGHKVYLDAIEEAFGSDVDYGQAIKVYGLPLDDNRIEARYSPSRCKEVQKNPIKGNPDPAHISTSHNERNNLTMRMSMRRFTRLTNGHSKKVENHVAAVNLHFMHYNFCRIHETLRVTPAMEAGIANHVWGLDEVIKLLEEGYERAA